MTLPTTSRVRAPLPILFFAAVLALAGCATSAPGPVGPISTGNPRVDPVTGEIYHSKEASERLVVLLASFLLCDILGAKSHRFHDLK